MGTIEELPNGNLLVRIDYVFSRHGGRKKIIVAGESSEISSDTHDSSVINTIARAYRWRKLLDTGRIKSVQELANAVNLDRSYVARVLRLTYLAPGIVQISALSLHCGQYSLGCTSRAGGCMELSRKKESSH